MVNLQSRPPTTTVNIISVIFNLQSRPPTTTVNIISVIWCSPSHPRIFILGGSLYGGSLSYSVSADISAFDLFKRMNWNGDMLYAYFCICVSMDEFCRDNRKLCWQWQSAIYVRFATTQAGSFSYRFHLFPVMRRCDVFLIRSLKKLNYKQSS